MTLKDPSLVRSLQLAYSAEKAAAFAYIGHAKSLCDRKEKGVVHPIAPDQVCWSFVWFLKITNQTSVDFGQKVAEASCLRRIVARRRSVLRGLLSYWKLIMRDGISVGNQSGEVLSSR